MPSSDQEAIKTSYGNILLNNKLEHFKKSIIELSAQHKKERIFKDLIKEVLQLYSVLSIDIIKLVINVEETAYPEILDYFTQVAKNFTCAKTPKQITDSVINALKDYEKLEKQLTQKQPLSPHAKAIIFGMTVTLIGALFVAGLFAGIMALSSNLVLIPAASIMSIAIAVTLGIMTVTAVSTLLALALLHTGIVSLDNDKDYDTYKNKSLFFEQTRGDYRAVNKAIEQIDPQQYQPV